MVRTLRITTGLILFAFVATHLLNLSLGLVSLEVLDKARPYFLAIWSNPVGKIVLMASMLTHIVLGLTALYWRNTLRMTRHDTLQAVTALLIVPLLVGHVLGVTLGAELFGYTPSYKIVLGVFWVQNPLSGLTQVLVVVVTWIHGCIGLFTWLRLKSWWPKLAIAAYPLAVAIPVFALLGFVEAGNEVITEALEAANSGNASPTLSEAEALARQELFAFYNTVKWTVIAIYGLIILATAAARAFRLHSKEDKIIELRYLRGPVLKAAAGTSLLEMARLNDLPHANICKGRGRCGTCRVRIISTSSALPPPTDLEQKTLDRFESPEGTRLACQIVPGAGVIELERLLPVDLSVRDLQSQNRVVSDNADANQAAELAGSSS